MTKAQVSQLRMRTDSPSPPPSSGRFLTIAALVTFVLALIARTFWAIQPRTVRWDEPDYLILARNLLRGQGYRVFDLPELHTPPAIPALASLVMRSGVEPELAMTVIHVLAGSVACILLLFLTWDLSHDVRFAWLAAGLAALLPSLVVEPLYWGSMTESLFIACLIGGMWAAWQMLKWERWQTALLAATGFALAYLTRPEGLFWWLAYGAAAVLIALKRRGGWLPIVVYGLSFLLMVAPYWRFLYMQTGGIQLSGKSGMTIAIGMLVSEQGTAVGNDVGAQLDSTGDEIMWLSPERFQISVLEIFRQDPAGSIWRLARNLYQIPTMLVNPLLGWPLLISSVVGFLAWTFSRRRWASHAFLLLSLLPLVVVPVIYIQPRLLLPAVPIALIWSAVGLVTIYDKFIASMRGSERMGRGWVLWPTLAICALVLLLLGQQREAVSRGLSSQTESHELAGLWLASHTQPGEAVMVRDSEVAFYADRPLVALPDASWPEILTYARMRDARILVIDDWAVERLRPQLISLLTPDQAPSELQYLTSFTDRNRTTLIYKLLSP